MSMKSIRWSALRLVSALVTIIVGGCAIGTPFPRWQATTAERDQQVVLVITRIVVNPSKRREFDRQTSLVINSMPSHKGLLGYSARRELFGDQGWTISVWADDAARQNFVRSAVHRRAIQQSESAIVTVELKRLTLSRSALPNNWASALVLFDGPANKRTYIH